MAQTTQPETHYIANASLAAGGLYLVGARGDDDPGHVLKVRGEFDLDALPAGVDYIGSDPADVWEYLPPAPEVWP